MVDNWITIFTIPAVNFNTSATSLKNLKEEREREREREREGERGRERERERERGREKWVTHETLNLRLI